MISYEIAFLESVEPYLEAVNFVIALVVVVIALYIYSILEGKFKKASFYMVSAIILFGVHEVFGTLSEFNVFKIEGLYAFTEFLFIVCLFVAFYKYKDFFFEISKNKK